MKRAPVAMEAAATGVQVPTATAGAVRQDAVEAIAGLDITPAPIGDGGRCRQRRVVWGAQDTIVLLPEKDDSPTADETAAGVVQGEDATAGAVVETADATAGAVGQPPTAGAVAEASNATAGAEVEAGDARACAVAEASDATAGVGAEVPAERGFPFGRSSARPPPYGGKAEGFSNGS